MTQSFSITKADGPCGATVLGVDLRNELSQAHVEELRDLWLKHHVLAFPDQALTDDDLERFSAYFGAFGGDPFIQPIAGCKHVIAVERHAIRIASSH